MGGREKFALVLVAAVLLAAGAAGCGGDDDSTSPGDTSAVGQADSGQGADSKAKPEQDAGSNPNRKAGTDDGGGGPAPGAGTGSDDDGESAGGTDRDPRGSGGGSNGSGGAPQGSKGFLTPGGDNSVQKFGTEARGSQFAAASAVVEAFMAARADHDWPAACKHLAAGTVDQVEKVIAPGEGCAATLTKASKNLPENGLPNTMTGPIDSFRVEGNRGFALWHGNDGVDYVLPLKMEGGWKLTLFEPTALGPPPPS